ncbi:McrC family protein [Paraburkholderia sp. RL17-381-BIF-C]|uniref:McrC family protein n=1 Tax=Paraburkholderia sp. RL17-381-BIF-C TaxID=3031635 RepID=UPI0038B788F8
MPKLVKSLVVREYERVPVVACPETDQHALTPTEVDALLRACASASGRVFEVGHKHVKFQNWCGVICAGNLTVEILPKIADAASFDRACLLRMLGVSNNFPVGSAGCGDLQTEHGTILLTLIRWFCDELFRQYHAGMPRSYVFQDDLLTSIRGRWRPDVEATRFPGRKDRMFCEFDELSVNNRHNQIIKATLKKIRPLTIGSRTTERSVELLLAWLADVSDVVATADDVRRLPQNRLVSRFKSVLQMCEWFLASQNPGLRSGDRQSTALVFEMNLLFQSFIGRVLRRSLPPELQLREEGPRRFLTQANDGQRKFQMKPDFCILQNDRVIAIIDTKWKRISPDAQDGKWAIQQADVYQLHAYAHAYDCRKVALWFPGHAALSPSTDNPTLDFLSLSEMSPQRSLLIDWVHLAGPSTYGGWMRSIVDQVRQKIATWLPLDGIVEATQL